MRSASVDIKVTVRRPLPLFLKSGKGRIPFEEITRSVLGGHYQLSLVICGDALARRINAQTRKKHYSPNVLSFPLARDEGEIFLNIRKAEREARRARISLRHRLAHLFVHGLYHLKGYDHQSDSEADRMEALEAKTLHAFDIRN